MLFKRSRFRCYGPNPVFTIVSEVGRWGGVRYGVVVFTNLSDVIKDKVPLGHLRWIQHDFPHGIDLTRAHGTDFGGFIGP